MKDSGGINAPQSGSEKLGGEEVEKELRVLEKEARMALLLAARKGLVSLIRPIGLGIGAGFALTGGDIAGGVLGGVAGFIGTLYKSKGVHDELFWKEQAIRGIRHDR